MDLVITVRAVGHSSLTTVFRPLLTTSAQVSRQIESQLAGAAVGAEKGARRAAGAYRTAYNEAGAAAEGWARRADAAAAVHHRRMLANVRELEREQRTSIDRQARDEERAGRQRAQAASAGLRTFGSLARSGVGLASRAANEGFGVDVDIFAAMGVARETRDLAGRATRSAATAKGEIASAADIDATVKAIHEGGDKAKLGYEAMGAGLEDFVSKSADLKTGNKVMGDLGIIAQATGANVKDLLSAAGDVNRELEDGPDRAEKLLAIMRLVAKQGAMGNVEVKDLAKFMGRMESTAFMYEGSKDKNIGILGALSQVAMKGGATSAADATRSAAAFARDLTKAKSLEEFQKMGIEVFSDKSKTKLRGPEAIITDVLKKTGGDLSKFSELFRNDVSKRVLMGFANVAQQAGGGDKGIAAVHEEFKRYSTTMSQKEMEAQAGTALAGDTAAAQQFRNEMEKAGEAVRGELAPAMKELAPVAMGAAKALGSVVAWGASNPELAITGAIVAAIGKAAMGDAIGKALSTRLGAAAGPIAVGAASFMITKAFIEWMSKETASGENASLAGDVQRANADTSGRLALAGKKDPMVALADATAAAAEDQRRLNQIKEAKTGTFLDYFDTIVPGSMTTAQVSEAHQDKGKEAEIQKDLAHQQQVIAALRELISATRANAPVAGAAAGPAVNTGAQTGGVR